MVTLEALDWPSELHVTDVDTIEVRVRLRDAPQTITGLRIRWASSNDAVLQVVQLQPTNPDDPEETLVAQLRAQVTARSGGPDTVSVVVDSGAGFERAESTFVIRVTQKWVAVSAGRAHTCGVTVDSAAYCWGEGDRGKLGNGRPLTSSAPVPVLGIGDLKFIAVSAGQESSCAIIAEGATYCWGSNDDGRLGNADPFERSQFVPVAVAGPSFQVVSLGQVACGIAGEFTAYCWGGNADDQLGSAGETPALDTCLSNNLKGCSRTPRSVTVGDTIPISYESISVGGHHVCALSHVSVVGAAYCWGTGPFGALGNIGMTSSPTLIPVSGGLTFDVISAGGDHTCGLATSNTTYCWGSNSDGQLGNDGTSDAGTPTLVPNALFATLTAGGRHTCALDLNDEAFCWGSGAFGQLGNGSLARSLMPAKVSGELRFESLSAGTSHTCGIAIGGSLYCWGEGAAGQLGTGDLQSRSVPTRVAEPQARTTP